MPCAARSEATSPYWGARARATTIRPSSRGDTDLRASRWAMTMDVTSEASSSPTIKPHARQIRAAAKMISESKRPVLYVGGGVTLARAHEDAVLAPVGEPGAATLKRALRQLIAIRNADGDPTD